MYCRHHVLKPAFKTLLYTTNARSNSTKAKGEIRFSFKGTNLVAPSSFLAFFS